MEVHKIFYHASNSGNLTELLPLSTLHGSNEKVCYITPLRAYALFYLRDMSINHVTCGVSKDGIVVYEEQFPNQLEKIYQGRSGYLYTCENGSQITAGHTKGVWVLRQPTKISTTEHINVKKQIQNAQYKAILSANRELILLYWNIGNVIIENSVWGNKFIDNFARDIKLEFPNTKGYSVRNLRYMRKFAAMFPEIEIVQVALACASGACTINMVPFAITHGQSIG